MKTDFLQYVELDRPCWIEARSVPTGDPATRGVHVSATQDDRPVFACTLESPSTRQDTANERQAGRS